MDKPQYTDYERNEEFIAQEEGKPSIRKIIISLFLTLIIFGIGAFFYNYLSSQKKSSVSEEPIKEVLRNVQVMSAGSSNVDNKIEIDGRLVAYERMNLFSKVTGLLLKTSKPFRKGVIFNEGDLLFELDTREIHYALLAQKSTLLNSITQIMPDLKIDYPSAFEKWKRYLDQFDVEKPVRDLPVVSSDQEKYFVASKNIYNTYYNIKSQEARLADYQIYAPFTGVITEANTYPGTLVSPGQRLGTIANTSRFELEAPINLTDMKYVKSGQRVKLYSSELEKEWTGTVKRISNVIDPATQYLPVFIELRGSGLREGMYLKGELKGNKLKDVTALPKTAVVNQTKVYLVKNGKVEIKDIEVIKRDAINVYVRGVNAEDQIITNSQSGLYTGQKVSVIKD